MLQVAGNKCDSHLVLAAPSALEHILGPGTLAAGGG